MRIFKNTRKIIVCFVCMVVITASFTLPNIHAKQTKQYQGKYMNTLNMMEVKEVNEDIFPDKNVALGSTVEVSGLEVEGKWTGDLLVDGDKDNVDSRWSSGVMRDDTTPTAQQIPQWAIIDLQAPSTQISNINIYFHMLVWGTDYEIQTASSKDGEWTTLESVIKADGDEKNPVDQITKPMEAKRYIRLLFKKMNTNALGHAISIKEVEINGKQIVEGNIALQKPVHVSALEVEGKWTGDKAVDGDYDDNDSRWSSGIMRSDKDPNTPQTPQWITIDLRADVSYIEEIKIHYYQLVWGTDYEIQTAPKLNGEWRTLEKLQKDNGDVKNPIDTFDQEMLADRYIRLYFNRMNTNAAGMTLSIRDIQIQGKQSYAPETGVVTSAKDVINRIQTLEPVDIHSKQVPLPEVASDYDIFVKGSDVESVISNDGKITAFNIGERDVDIIVKVVHKEDSEDTAEKSFVVRVPDKSVLFPGLFPKIEKPNAKPKVLPALQEWFGYEGAFQLKDNTRLLINDSMDANTMNIVKSMQADIEDITGKHVDIKRVKDDTDVQKDDIYFEKLADDSYQLGEEGYLSITNDLGMRIYSNTYTGLLYGSVTALQILSQNPDTCMIPYGVIRDYPKYEVRGIMLDIARTPYRMQMLKDVSKYLSWFKMNELHLHVNDDFGGNTEGMFRLQSELYPSLKTTTKTGLSASDYFFDIYGEPHYSKEEYRNLQFLANDFGVDIVTEIDSPGHSKSFNDYARDNPDNLDWLGPNKLTANPRNDQLLDLVGQNAERSRRFITSLFDEFTSGNEPMFTSDTVHIGADEYWGATAAEKEELRKYIVDLYNVLTTNGKKTRMWGQMKAYPGVTPIAKDIQLDLWHTAYEDVKARLSEGYQVINVDEGFMYGNPGRNRRDVVNVEYVYENWDPTVFNGIKIPKGEPNLIGGKTALWGDENRQGIVEKDLHERIVRQLAVTSEKTWGATTAADTYDSYEYKFTKLRNCPSTEIAMDIDSKSSLVASYDMQNVKDGVLYDASGNAFDAKVSNGKVVEEEGTTYMRFNGDTKIQSPLKTISYPYTVSFDVKVGKKDQNNSESSLFSGYDGRLQAAGIDDSMSINRVMYGQTLDYTLTNDKSNITIVGTFEGTKIYVNGKLHKFLSRKDPNNNKYQPENLMSSFVFPMETIGDGFEGYIGNIKVYNKALAADLFDQNINKVNVAQDVASAQDIQNVNEGGWDVEAKKINVAWKAFDGDGRDLSGQSNTVTSERDSYWNGGPHASAWLSADLGTERSISSIRIQWNAPGFAKAFKIQASLDNENWDDVYVMENNNSDVNIVTLDHSVTYRYIRMQGIQKNGGNNYSIQEFEVFEHVDKNALQSMVKEAAKIVKQEHLQFGEIEEASQKFFAAYVYAKALVESPFANNEEVEEAKKILENEMQNVSDETNKEVLKTVIDEASSYIEEGIYDVISDESVKMFKGIYEHAIDTFDDAKATQNDIDTAVEDLKIAIKDIVYERAFVQLQNLIEEYEDLDLSKYANNSQKELFVNLLKEAEAIKNGEDYAIIVSTSEKLQTAKKQLILLEDTVLSKMILKSMMNKVEIISSSNNYKMLVPNIKDTLDKAYHYAQLVYLDEQVDNEMVLSTWLTLSEAMQFIDFRADRQALKLLLDAYKEFDLQTYSEVSVKKFEEAYIIAEGIHADKEASLQSIETAYADLDASIKGLAKTGDVDVTTLELVIVTLNNEMQMDDIYKKDVYWSTFQSTLKKLKELSKEATQERINETISLVTKAYEDLRVLPSKQQLSLLKNFVDKALRINRGVFAKEELSFIDVTYAKSKLMIEDFDSKQFAFLWANVEKANTIINDKTGGDPILTPPTGDTSNVAFMMFILSISLFMLIRIRKRVS